jgi:ribosomal 50S subunit-associated protein YjgA (DUF615 family)
MLKFIDKLFFKQSYATAQLDINKVQSKEEPKVAELRAKAKAKLEQWGRKSLLENGPYSMNNTVLKGPRG